MSSSTLRRSLTVALLTGGLTVPATGSPVNALTPAETTYVRVAGAAGPTSTGVVTAKCPAGYHVVSGGFEANGFANNSGVNSVYPIDDASDTNTTPDDGIRVRVYNDDTSSTTPAATAICATATSTYTTATGNDVAGRARTLKATCPTGTHVIGGGVRSSGPGAAVFLSSSGPFDNADSNIRPDDGWQVVTVNRDTVDHSITAFATCSTKSVAYNFPTSQVSTIEQGGGLYDPGPPDCNAGLGHPPIQAGGLLYNGPAKKFRMFMAVPVDGDASGTTDDSWQFQAVDDTLADSNTATLSSICESG